MPFSGFLDACVLYPSALRDTLLRVAERDLYRPLWSERVLAETRTVMIRKGMPAERADYSLRCMGVAFEDSIVTGWEDLESSMRNHPKDRHVLAAAVRGHADVLVTFNLRDFPDTARRAPHPALTPQEVVTALERCGTPEFAKQLRDLL